MPGEDADTVRDKAQPCWARSPKEIKGTEKRLKVSHTEGEREEKKKRQGLSLYTCRETIQDKRKGQRQRRPSKNNCITSNPCSRPTFIMSLHRFGTMHMTSTAFCGWGESRVKGQAPLQLHLRCISNLSFSPERAQRFHPPTKTRPHAGRGLAGVQQDHKIPLIPTYPG